MKVFSVTLLAIVFLSLQKQVSSQNASEVTVKELLKKVADSQIEKGTSFHFPYSLYKRKGIYPSFIHLAFFGHYDETLLRREFKVFDNNAFVTLWVSSILLEIARFSEGKHPSDINQLLNAIEAISMYHDKNYGHDTSLLVFWPQEYNEATGVWLCRPVNIGKTMDFGNKAEPVVKRMFTDIGLQGLWNEISPLVNEILTASSAFYIPADFDDTFVNIGFGSLLKNYQPVSREPYLSWLRSNSNLESAIAALKKYSYKPFSSEFDSKAIDPRTYFYMRHFLEEAKSKGELSLVTTWVQSLSESRDNFYNHYTMPFNVNNVDLTVSANVLYGLTAAVLSDMQDPNSWFDEEVQMIYLNTTSLVMYEISNNFSSRPDLALTYYPSVFNFYWFTSRILNLLNSHDQLPYPVMQTVKMRMSSTLRGEGTNDILQRATRHNDFIYFDDFLGDNDKNLYGERVNRGDDRISSTAMAVNALFYIWANASGVLLTGTPEPVTYTLVMACHWLSDNALSDRLEHINAFFSGSVKLGSVDIPFFYPLNYIERVNGSLISSDHHFLGSDSDVLSAVIGTIQEDRYKELLEQKHYGYKTPTEFHGFNSKHVPFPFWSSTILTDASSALALTQCTLNNM